MAKTRAHGTFAALNVVLKAALWGTGKPQERIARAARIAPQKLSHVLRGRRELDEGERKRLARVLGRTEHELFGTPQPESTSQSESAA